MSDQLIIHSGFGNQAEIPADFDTTPYGFQSRYRTFSYYEAAFDWGGANLQAELDKGMVDMDIDDLLDQFYLYMRAFSPPADYDGLILGNIEGLPAEFRHPVCDRWREDLIDRFGSWEAAALEWRVRSQAFYGGLYGIAKSFCPNATVGNYSMIYVTVRTGTYEEWAADPREQWIRDLNDDMAWFYGMMDVVCPWAYEAEHGHPYGPITDRGTLEIRLREQCRCTPESTLIAPQVSCWTSGNDNPDGLLSFDLCCRYFRKIREVLSDHGRAPQAVHWINPNPPDFTMDHIVAGLETVGGPALWAANLDNDAYAVLEERNRQAPALRETKKALRALKKWRRRG